MANLRCPMCGKPNPAGSVTCQFCGARIVPMGSSAPGAKSPPAPSPEDDTEGWLRRLRGETPAETPAVPAAPEGEFEIPGAPEAAPEVPSAEPALEPVPVATQAPEPFLAPETEEQKKKPFLQPQPVDQEASVLGRLIKLANRLDEQGRSQEADAVDRLIQITLAKVGIKSHE